jgi:RimJ/RimL family protein N-acetyltransferase
LKTVETNDVMPIIKEYADDNNLYCDGHLLYGLTEFNRNISFSNAIMMDDTHYNKYWEFCSETYPAMYELIEPDDQMEEEYKEMIRREARFCLMVDDKIVSMTESENVPNKPKGMVNLGINTLRDYRRKGYASEVCAAFIDNCIQQDILPIWQCDINNVASQSLAEKLGFKCLGCVYSVSALIESW